MKPWQIVGLAGMIGILIAGSVNAQWVQTGGPEGGSVGSVISSGGYLIAAVNGESIYRSSNNGASWVSTGSTLPEVGSLTANGSYVFALTDSGIYRSADNGATWTRASSGLPVSNSFYYYYENIGVFATNGTYLFVVTDSGIYRSADNGTSWSPENSGIPANFYFNSIAINGSNIYLLPGVYSDGSCSVYRSTNNGQSWAIGDSGLPACYVRSLLVFGGYVFALPENDSIYRQSNNAAHWVAVDAGLPGGEITCLAASGGWLFAGSYSGIYRSPDSGVTWTPANAGLPANSELLNLSASGGYLSAEIEISANSESYETYYSGNNGMTWTSTLSGIPEGAYIEGFAASGGFILAETNGNGVYRSSDSGSIWALSISGLLSADNYILGTCNGTVLSGVGPLLFSSSNGGAGWNETNFPAEIPGGYAILSFSQNGNDFYAATTAGLYQSTDNGTTWTATGLMGNEVAAVVGAGSSLWALENGILLRSTNGGASWAPIASGFVSGTFLANSGGSIVVCSEGGVISRSADNGATWSTGAVPGSANNLAEAFVVKNSLYFVLSSDSGLFRSEDNGITWTTVNTGLKGTISHSALISAGNGLFAAGDSGIFLSVNNGTTWNTITTGLPSDPVVSLCELNGYLYAGTQDYSVWRCPLSNFGIAVLPEGPVAARLIPDARAKYAHGAVTVHYTVGSPADVSIDILT